MTQIAGGLARYILTSDGVNARLLLVIDGLHMCWSLFRCVQSSSSVYAQISICNVFSGLCIVCFCVLVGFWPVDVVFLLIPEKMLYSQFNVVSLFYFAHRCYGGSIMEQVQSSKSLSAVAVRCFAMASLLSAGINSVLFFLAKQQGVIRSDILMPSNNQPLDLLPVVLSSIIGCGGAALVCYALAKNLPQATAKQVFLGVSAVLLVLSFWSPTIIPNVPMDMMVFLNVLHVVVAVAAVASLQRVFSPLIVS